MEGSRYHTVLLEMDVPLELDVPLEVDIPVGRVPEVPVGAHKAYGNLVPLVGLLVGLQSYLDLVGDNLVAQGILPLVMGVLPEADH